MSTFSPNKHIELVAHNGAVDTWDAPTNANWGLVDTALGSSVTLNATGLNGAQTLATASYQALTIIIGGVPTGAITYGVPAGVGGFWIFINTTTGGQTVGIASAAGGPTIVVAAGANTIVSCDGSATGMRLGVNVPPAAAGSTTQVQYNSGGTLAGSANLVFDGTTLSTTALSVGGNTTLGNSAGNNLQLIGATVSIPNGLNIGSNNLFLNGTQAAIGTATPFAGAAFTVAGNIKITTGGLIFSDATQLLSASSLGAAGAAGNVQFNNGSSGFAADSAYTYNSGTHTLSLNNLTLGTPLPQASGGTGLATLTGTTGTATGKLVLDTSPTLVGVPLAPTATPRTNTQQLATTAYADANLIQITTVPVTSTGTFTGTYPTTTGAAPTSAGGVALTPFATSFTPKNASSVIEIDVLVKGTNVGSSDQFVVALFNGTTLVDFTTAFVFAGTGQQQQFNMTTWLIAPGTSALALTVRIGSNSGTSFLLNEANNGAGGTPQAGWISWLVVKEILPRP